MTENLAFKVTSKSVTNKHTNGLLEHSLPTDMSVENVFNFNPVLILVQNILRVVTMCQIQFLVIILLLI